MAGCISGGPYFQIPVVYWLSANGTNWTSSSYNGGSTAYTVGGCGGDGWLPGLHRRIHHWNFSFGSLGVYGSNVIAVPAPRIYNDLGEPWHTQYQNQIPQGSMQGGAGQGNVWYQGGGLGGRGYGAGGGGGYPVTGSQWYGGCSGQLVSLAHVLDDTTSYAVTIGDAVVSSSYLGAGAPGAVAVFW